MVLIRIVTGSLLALAAVFVTLYLSTLWFAVVLMLVMLIGLNEWGQLVTQSRLWLIGAAAAMVAAGWECLYWPRVLLIVCAGLSVFWICQIYSLRQGGLSRSFSGLSGICVGALVLFGGWSALIFIHQQPDTGAQVTLGILMIVWAADGFAYFFGKMIGQRKLAPQISPNKTVEGLLGGLLGSCLVALIYAFLVFNLSWSDWQLWLWMLAAFCGCLISVVGDLYQSRLKRIAGVKDSGSLLPGHGGILDRIDGLVAAAPVFAGIWWFAL